MFLPFLQPLSKMVQDLSQTAEKLWGGEVNWRTAMAYDAAISLITAIDRNPHPTRTSIQKTLANPSFVASGADDRISFLASGDSPKQMQLVEVRSDHSNPFDYKFVPISGVRYKY